MSQMRSKTIQLQLPYTTLLIWTISIKILYREKKNLPQMNYGNAEIQKIISVNANFSKSPNAKIKQDQKIMGGRKKETFFFFLKGTGSSKNC